MVRALLILILAIWTSLLTMACSQPAATQIDSSQYSGRLDEVTLEVSTIT